jgi:phosphatidylserine/phosphatidylglycerophosphate/cardiolipin synthase-like enzyme
LSNLPYLGTIEGKIIQAISVENLRQWGEIRDYLGFTNEQLKPILKALEKQKIVEDAPGGFKVEYELWLKYKAHFGEDWAKEKLAELAEEKREEERYQSLLLQRQELKDQNYLRERMFEWIKFKNISMGKNSAHLFLKGDLLDSLLRDLIPRTRNKILVVNPYVESCAFSDSLIQASEKGVKVVLVTQKIESNWSGKRVRDKEKYHKRLNESSIEVHYNDSVHAKLFILDDQVLSASSMNLYSESVAGKLWEAGIVTVEPTNIQRAMESFNDLIKQ